MPIGSPSVESVLVVANVVVALCLGVVYLTEDRGPTRSTAFDLPPQRPEAPPVLLVAGADSPADLLVARHTADLLSGALLAVPARGLTAAMREDLAGARPDRVLVLGGAAVVGDETARTLRDLTRAPVTRISGPDRFSTAAKVASSQFDPPVERLLVVSGDDLDGPRTQDAAFPDVPLLLVERDHVPGEAVAALRHLRPRSIVVAAEATSVSDAVLRRLREFAAEEVVRSSRP